MVAYTFQHKPGIPGLLTLLLLAIHVLPVTPLGIKDWKNSPFLLYGVVSLVLFGMGIYLRAAANFMDGHRVHMGGPIVNGIRFLRYLLSLRHRPKSQAENDRVRYRLTTSGLGARVVFAFVPALVFVVFANIQLHELPQAWHGSILSGAVKTSEGLAFLLGPLMAIVLIFQSPDE